MQILGKRSKLLLIAVAIAMLVALGVSFATWDTSAVKATNGDLSQYANAKVGDIIEFGRYYQTLEKDNNGEYVKTPIEWIVVDKDERTGQITLMSKYILACGSYFGNYYAASGSSYGWNYNAGSKAEVGGIPYNQAYVDSTVRAYLNNLERLDLGGDAFESGIGYVPSAKNSTTDTGLLSSVGFSNQRYWTGLSAATEADKNLVEAGNYGLVKIADNAENNEIYFQRPINNSEYRNRPATIGFLSEAFDDEEERMIVPKQIAGYTGHRWPDSAHDVSTKSYVEGAYDKIWLPSATELNVTKGQDWYGNPDDAWTNPSDEAGSRVFEYFASLEGSALTNALKAIRTELATDGKVGNYSIPVYDKGTIIAKTAISTETNINSSDHYWTRSPMSYWCHYMRTVNRLGLFTRDHVYYSHLGVRPCVILKY